MFGVHRGYQLSRAICKLRYKIDMFCDFLVMVDNIKSFVKVICARQKPVACLWDRHFAFLYCLLPVQIFVLMGVDTKGVVGYLHTKP